MKIILLALILLYGCSKQQDFSYLNTDRRNCAKFVRISERYTIDWKWLTTIRAPFSEEACDSNVAKYRADSATTTWDPKKCPSPDSTMPEFRIERRYYEEIK